MGAGILEHVSQSIVSVLSIFVVEMILKETVVAHIFNQIAHSICCDSFIQQFDTQLMS